ncbi:hypothetical protein [Bradyrhizobium sp. USDA 3256]
MTAIVLHAAPPDRHRAASEKLLMSSFDCAQHTFVEARLVQRSTAVNVPQRVAFGGEAITAPWRSDDNAISAAQARVIAVWSRSG